MINKIILPCIVAILLVISSPLLSYAGMLEWKMSRIEKKEERADKSRQKCLDKVAKEAGSTIGFNTLAQKCYQRYNDDTEGLEDKKKTFPMRYG